MKPVCWLRTALTALAVASTPLVGTSSWSTPVSGAALLSQTSDVVVAPGQPASQLDQLKREIASLHTRL